MACVLVEIFSDVPYFYDIYGGCFWLCYYMIFESKWWVKVASKVFNFVGMLNNFTIYIYGIKLLSSTKVDKLWCRFLTLLIKSWSKLIFSGTEQLLKLLTSFHLVDLTKAKLGQVYIWVPGRAQTNLSRFYSSSRSKLVNSFNNCSVPEKINLLDKLCLSFI